MLLFTCLGPYSIVSRGCGHAGRLIVVAEGHGVVGCGRIVQVQAALYRCYASKQRGAGHLSRSQRFQPVAFTARALGLLVRRKGEEGEEGRLAWDGRGHSYRVGSDITEKRRIKSCTVQHLGDGSIQIM